MTVEKALITVKADNLSKEYCSPNPELTYSISGFVNGEDENVISGTPVLSTNAETLSPPGKYSITISGELSANNYNFSFVNGTLTIISSKQLYLPAVLH